MRDLCDRYSRDTDYYVKSTPEKPNTYSYAFALQYLAFFSVRFDFEYDRSIYQKMLFSKASQNIWCKGNVFEQKIINRIHRPAGMLDYQVFIYQNEVGIIAIQIEQPFFESAF